MPRATNTAYALPLFSRAVIASYRDDVAFDRESATFARKRDRHTRQRWGHQWAIGDTLVAECAIGDDHARSGAYALIKQTIRQLREREDIKITFNTALAYRHVADTYPDNSRLLSVPFEIHRVLNDPDLLRAAVAQHGEQLTIKQATAFKDAHNRAREQALAAGAPPTATEPTAEARQSAAAIANFTLPAGDPNHPDNQRLIRYDQALGQIKVDVSRLIEELAAAPDLFARATDQARELFADRWRWISNVAAEQASRLQPSESYSRQHLAAVE